MDVDRLPSALDVHELRDARFGDDGPQGARAPHRHEYHELHWARAGEGRHLVDGEPLAIEPGTLVLLGRGRVHVLERARGLTGAVVRFGDDLLADPAGAARLLGTRGPRAIPVPPTEAAALEALIAALGAEARRPPDRRTAAIERHLLGVLLAWAERWWDGARGEAPALDPADARLHREFLAVLERDFARHHDAAHFAQALRVPPAALSRALAAVTGQPTKALVTDRVMVEAERLLRFTDLSVSEVAHRCGFGDPLYFSRAFKRHHGQAPGPWRAAVRGG